MFLQVNFQEITFFCLLCKSFLRHQQMKAGIGTLWFHASSLLIFWTLETVEDIIVSCYIMTYYLFFFDFWGQQFWWNTYQLIMEVDFTPTSKKLLHSFEIEWCYSTRMHQRLLLKGQRAIVMRDWRWWNDGTCLEKSSWALELCIPFNSILRMTNSQKQNVEPHQFHSPFGNQQQ